MESTALQGRGSIAQDGEFERQAIAMGLDEKIDAAGVGGKDGAVGQRESAIVFLGHAAHAEAAGSTVDIEGARHR